MGTIPSLQHTLHLGQDGVGAADDGAGRVLHNDVHALGRHLGAGTVHVHGRRRALDVEAVDEEEGRGDLDQGLKHSPTSV